MKKILTSFLLVASSCSYAEFNLVIPLENQQGGALPVNSITFKLSDSETPTNPSNPSYENTGGSFGTGNSSNSMITAETAATYVDRTTVAYTLTTTHKLILDSVSVKDVSVMVVYIQMQGSLTRTVLVLALTLVLFMYLALRQVLFLILIMVWVKLITVLDYHLILRLLADTKQTDFYLKRLRPFFF